MRQVKFVMFLFYKYYSKGGTHRIPYFSALCATVFLIYIHVFQLLIILDKVDLLPMQAEDVKIVKYFKLAAFLLPIFLIIGYMVRESDLKTTVYDEEKIRKGGVYLILYIVFSVILLFVLMFALGK